MMLLVLQIIAAMAGTIAFSVLFFVPRQYYLYCGMIGAAGWAVYSISLPLCGAAIASLLATMAIVLLSRFTAIWKQCPVTVFLIAGIFPLVPGTGIYWTAYYIVTNQLRLAVGTGYEAVKCAVAIVLGIVFIFEIPQSLFMKILGRTKKNQQNKN